jgi:hypothetical protein
MGNDSIAQAKSLEDDHGCRVWENKNIDVSSLVFKMLIYTPFQPNFPWCF